MADEINRASLDEWDDWEEPVPSIVELDAFEAELDDVIEGLDIIQADLSYQHAQNALNALVKQVDLTDPERTGLETEIQQLQSMIEKLELQVVHIAVFGMVSRGKSSLLNALLGQPVFTTGPVHGVTRTSQQANWNVEVVSPPNDPDDVIRVSLSGTGRSRIELIDTPGIDEIDGQSQEKMAREVAKQADLILFVVAGDITRVEYEALADLRDASKPILLVFNKIDQYPEADRNEIYQKICDERVRSLLSPNEVVMAAAAPLVAVPKQRPDGTWSAELVTGLPQIDDLKLKILEILDREGKSLLALNTLLYADDINEQILERKLAIRDHAANRLIWQSVTVKALAIALNPITLLDIISSATLDIALILSLSKLYGLPMTQRDAVGLLRNIAIAMGGISISELLTTLGLSSLKGALGLAVPITGGASLLPYISVAIAQASVAGVSSYGIGQVTKQYLANGASWGQNSPKVVIREILATMDQSHILNRIKAEIQIKIDPVKSNYPKSL